VSLHSYIDPMNTEISDIIGFSVRFSAFSVSQIPTSVSV